MNKILLVLSLFVFSASLWAAPKQVIDTLGSSPKGQYVALEEYGYQSHKHTYYVKIKVINVWTKEFVGKSIEVEMPAQQPRFLQEARLKAKVLAQDELKKFNIKS